MKVFSLFTVLYFSFSTWISFANEMERRELIKDYFQSFNQSKVSNYNNYCYKYLEHIDFYKDQFRTFYFRSKYKVKYDTAALSELDQYRTFENDTLKVELVKYSINESVVVGALSSEERTEAYRSLNKLYQTDDVETTVDPCNVLLKRMFFNYEHVAERIEGRGEEYFMFITSKASGRTYIQPYDLSQTSALTTELFNLEFVLDVFSLNGAACRQEKDDLMQIGTEVFDALKENEWYPLYCKYGYTAQVIYPEMDYDFGRSETYNSRRNIFLHKLHYSQDAIRKPFAQVYKTLRYKEVSLHQIHIIDFEDDDKQYAYILIEYKEGEEFKYIKLVCQARGESWILHSGPSMKIFGGILKDYIKNLKNN